MIWCAAPAPAPTRPNRAFCRELGIASVVVMPIVGNDQVLGGFELLSGNPRAFDERDLSALLRLGVMVENSVQHAVRADFLPAQPAVPEMGPQVDRPAEAPPLGTDSPATVAAPVPVPPIPETPPADEKKSDEKKQEALPVPAKTLFWSAAMRADANGPPKKSTGTITVPPVLRNLQKCQACGFPVSQGRAFCVECEEKHWRGQRWSQPAAGSPAPQNAAKKVISAPFKAASAATSSAASSPDILTLSNAGLPADLSGSHNYAPFSGSTVESRSWFAANKYVLGALLVVAIVVATIVWLR